MAARQDSIVVPERICSEDEKTGTNQIRNTHILLGMRGTFGEND